MMPKGASRRCEPIKLPKRGNIVISLEWIRTMPRHKRLGRQNSKTTMAYFRNYHVNLLNLHSAIQSIAMTGGGAFFCVYLRKAGLSMPAVLMVMAAILLG